MAISPHEHFRKIGSYIGNRTLAKQMAGRESRITEVRNRNADYMYSVLKRGCAISLPHQVLDVIVVIARLVCSRKAESRIFAKVHPNY